jgi:predicted RNA-binding Zn-ribbon protein involved in translation (DUF1610 family)
MVIEFLCPNGHKIRCGDERAGRAAKCPKCDEKFYIPEPWDLEKSDSGTWPTVSAQSRSVGPSGTGTKTGDKPGRDEQIEFLCPNGHRLSAATRLQGRPGECPECGTKFRIPTYEDARGKPQADEEKPLDGIDLTTNDDSAMNLDEMGAFEGNQDSDARPAVEEILAAVRTSGSGRLASAGGAGSLGKLFPQLWARKSPGAVIELHLSGGEKIVPNRFSSKLSQGSHGVFLVEETDQTHTLAVVAWESIERLLVRGVKSVPEGFDA